MNMPVHDQALLQVLLRERSKLMAYIWSFVRDAEVAEDIFQEVSLLAFQKRDSIAGPESVLPWLRAVARHRAMKAFTARSKRPLPLDESLLDDLDSAWAERDAASSSSLREALRHCMEQLTDKARRIVSLRYGEGLSGQQVATALCVQVRSVYQAMTRIHVALASCIRQQIAHRK
jgi:RNA polymerase sigma-70 factor, ECF subfamily